MKFFSFKEYEYDAIIYAKDVDQALEKYDEEVTVVAGEEKELTPSVMDIDIVLHDIKTLYALHFIDDPILKEHGVCGLLYKIITSEEPLVIFGEE